MPSSKTPDPLVPQRLLLEATLLRRLNAYLDANDMLLVRREATRLGSFLVDINAMRVTEAHILDPVYTLGKRFGLIERGEVYEPHLVQRHQGKETA